MELELHDTDEGLTVIGLDGQKVATFAKVSGGDFDNPAFLFFAAGLKAANGDLWHVSQAKYVIQDGEVMPEFRFLDVALLGAGAPTFG